MSRIAARRQHEPPGGFGGRGGRTPAHTRRTSTKLISELDLSAIGALSGKNSADEVAGGRSNSAGRATTCSACRSARS